MTKIVAVALLWALSFVLPPMPAVATQSETHGIHAVPAPGPVTIDGNLEDWDLSGQTLMCYDVEHLRDTNSAQVAMMYDTDNLYVSVHFKSPHPLGNHHDPRYQADKGWAADAVQLRVRTDRIAHVTAWDFVDRQEPAIQITYGTDSNPMGGDQVQLMRTNGWKLERGAEMAFKEDADGKGYVQEMKLPWALLSLNKRYSAGDTFACGVELLWGTSDWPDMRYADNLAPGKTDREFFWTNVRGWGPVFLEPSGHVHLPIPTWQAAIEREKSIKHGPVPISYVLPKDGVVTLAVNDSLGNRVRNLTPAQPRLRGKNVEYWDGLDDSGKPVHPGKYTFTAICHDPIHVNYALAFANPGNPPWPTPDGTGQFYADHTPPQAVAAGGDTVALGCPIGEAGQPLIACNLAGQRLWGQANRVFAGDQIVSLATDGKTLWVGSDGSKASVYRDEIATGLFSAWDKEATDSDGHVYKILDMPVSTTPATNFGDKTGAPLVHNLTSLAYHDGLLAVSLAVDGEVKVLNGATGETVRTCAVAAPQSVAFDTDGSLIVLSQDRLLRVGNDGATKPFTSLTYPGSYGLAVDNERNVYLSVRGSEQNVKVFDPNGTLVREIGKRGGRPSYGVYDANGMRNPAQIAIDGEGRLWVTESNYNPKRTSVWDTKTGKLLRDLAGTTTYAGAGSVNPYDPTEGYSDDTVYKLDWGTGEYAPVYSIAKRETPDDLFPPSVHNLTSREMRNQHGLYIYTTGNAATSSITTCTLFDGQRWRSVAAFGKVSGSATDRSLLFASPVFAGHAGQIFSWSDKNGDGLVQADEVTFASPATGGLHLDSYYWGQLPSPDGTLNYLSLHAEPHSIVKFPITDYTACGAPVYNPGAPAIVPVGPQLGGGNGEGHTIGGRDGRVYVNQDPILAIDANGKVLGSYPSHFTSVHGSHSAHAASPGTIIGPSSFLGTGDFGKEAGEVFDLNGNLGENYLFTQDGLLVQSLFKDVRSGADTPAKAVRGMPMDNTTAGGESFGGNFVRAADGNVYLTIGGTDARVLKVTGLDTIRHFGGKFTYTPSEYVEAIALTAENASKTIEAKTYDVAKTAQKPAIDGDPAKWPELSEDSTLAMNVEDSPDLRYARVSARYDDDNLYLGYRVFSQFDHLRNNGQDEHLLFKTGDAVDLMIGPSAQTGPAGDLRLLMTSQNGHLLAVLNEKAAPGASVSDRYVFTAPWHIVAFDKVAVAPEVQLAERAIDGGYFVEAAIPWKLLDVRPVAGLSLKADVGVLFADHGGTTTVSRQYWSNKATGLVNDVPGEADLTPELWGTFVLR